MVVCEMYDVMGPPCTLGGIRAHALTDIFLMRHVRRHGEHPLDGARRPEPTRGAGPAGAGRALRRRACRAAGPDPAADLEAPARAARRRPRACRAAGPATDLRRRAGSDVRARRVAGAVPPTLER